jgi:ATP-dependent Clp protease ATP-binding subunit ClpC
VLNELKNTFRPEFLNRVDSTVVFHALSREHIHEIVDLMLRDVDAQLSFKGVTLEVTDAAKEWLGDRGYDETFGARPLRRLIQNEIEDRLSEALQEGQFGPGDRVVIDCADDEITLKCVSQPALT